MGSTRVRQSNLHHLVFKPTLQYICLVSLALKKRVHSACLERLRTQIDELQSAVDKVRESIEGEDKSSAGDKFETARAIAQTEMERLVIQQQKARSDYGILSQINPTHAVNHVQIGSLVETDSKTLFISIALGKLEMDGAPVFVVSPTSPIGQRILGLTAGDRFQLGAQEDRIRSIC